MPINTVNLLDHPTITRQFFGQKFFLHTFFFPGHCCSIFLLKERTKKMSTRTKQACLQLLMVAFQATLITMSSSAGLQYNFYSSSCPNAEQTVRNVVNGMIDADPTMPAAFLRLLFHDCFVMVRNAS